MVNFVIGELQTLTLKLTILEEIVVILKIFRCERARNFMTVIICRREKYKVALIICKIVIQLPNF